MAIRMAATLIAHIKSHFSFTSLELVTHFWLNEPIRDFVGEA